MFNIPTRTFEIYRNGVYLSTQNGVCARNGQKKYGFDVSVDVKVKDVLIEQESHNEYYVVDLMTVQGGFGSPSRLWVDLKIKHN